MRVDRSEWIWMIGVVLMLLLERSDRCRWIKVFIPCAAFLYFKAPYDKMSV